MKIGSIVSEVRRDIADMQQTLKGLEDNNDKHQRVSTSSLTLLGNR